MRLVLVSLCALLVVGCRGVEAVPGTQVKMVFARTTLYDAPFPSDDLLRSDGTIALDLFPNPKKLDLISQGLTLLGRDAHGFSTTSGIFLQLSAPLDVQSLPDLAGSVAKDAAIFLTAVDPASKDFLVHLPVQVAFHEDGGPYGSPNLLSLLPLQGRPLLPNTRYAAIVLRKAKDAQGKQLGVSLEMAKLAAGFKPEGMPDEAFARYSKAISVLLKANVTGLAGIAVFTTDDPAGAFKVVQKDVLSRALPVPEPFTLNETFDDYCVFSTTIQMPVYQAGEPPYANTGGRWVFDRQGVPQLQNFEKAKMVVTVPRATIPAAGLPATVFIRTGGGGDRPLVDRGQHATAHGQAIVPGSGPALQFAQAGFAGISVDGPHGGLRNVTSGDEQVLIFNLFNAGALRDNVRQSALEIVVLAHVLETLSLDATACPGARTAAGSATVTFDVSKLALMGHSMGATIAPLVLANEPKYRAAILSGSGASWIENIIFKQKPVDIRPFAEVLIGYASEGRSLVAEDPVLSLVQWAAEPADSQIYARPIIQAPAPGESPRHVLMFEGLVDHYILPRIANAMSLSLGLDLAGETYDSVEQTGLPLQTPLATVLPFVGRGLIPLPASLNLTSADGSKVTGVVVQHPEDQIEDGHEIAYQSPAARREYRCFLESFAAGAPQVPAPSANFECN
jgi:hypothetical protein